jgi:FSR family fosmidomycin resistance protein-like MFS transporter
MTHFGDKREIKGNLILLSVAHLMSDVYGSIAVTLLPVWVNQFNLSFSAAGFLVFVRSAGAAVSAPIGGYFADRTAKPMFPLGMLVVAFSMSFVGLTPNYPSLIILILLGTVAQSFFGPQAASTAAQSVDKLKSFRVGLFLAGGTLGAAIGPIAIASLVETAGLRQTWLMVIPGLVLSIVLYRTFSLGVKPASRATKSLQNWDSRNFYPTLALGGVLLLQGAADTGILALLPLLVEQEGGGLITVGAFISLFKLSGAAGALIAGYISDRINWKPVMIASYLLASLILYSFLRVEGFLALTLVALLGTTLLSSRSYTMILAQRSFPGRASTATGLFWSLILIGGALGALTGGFLADDLGVRTSLMVLGVTFPISAAILALGIRDPIFASEEVL